MMEKIPFCTISKQYLEGKKSGGGSPHSSPLYKRDIYSSSTLVDLPFPTLTPGPTTEGVMY